MRLISFAGNRVRFDHVPVMLYLGLVTGLFAGIVPGQRRGIGTDLFLVAGIVVVVAGFVGARLWHMATLWPSYRRNWRRAWQRSAGDQVIFGAILLGLAVSVPLLAALGLNFLAFWDAGAIAALAGASVGRLGCVLNGCCAGRATSGRFGMLLSDHRGISQRRIPTELLEVLLCLTLLGIALTIPVRTAPPGIVLLTSLTGFGAGRFVLEGWRERASAAARQLSGLLALAGAGAGIVVLLV